MKKGLLIGVPLLLLIGAGTTVGLSVMGIVNVPFLPFGKKKGPPPPKDDGKGGPFNKLFAMTAGAATQAETAIAQEKAKIPPPPAAPPPDTGPGEAKLAGLWAQMPTDKLVAVVQNWPEEQLGRILAKMDDDAVTKLLAALPPARATSLCKAVAAATDKRAANVHQT